MSGRRKTLNQLSTSKEVKTWFPQPYDRAWDLVGESAFNSVLKTLGGKLSDGSTVREFKKVTKAFLKLFVNTVEKMISGKLFLKRQLASMYSESVAPAPEAEESSGSGTTRKYVSDGQSFWSTDPVGLGPDQDTFDSLSRDEQNVCEWLQTFTRDIFLFHVDRTRSPSFVSALRTELRSARLRSSGAKAIKTPHHTTAKTLTTTHVFKFLSRGLRDDSPETALETTVSIVRPERAAI